MARLALNKSSLKRQRDQLKTYSKFLPSLELKRLQLMIAYRQARRDLDEIDQQIAAFEANQEPLHALLGATSIPLEGLFRVRDILVSETSAVGVRLPTLDGIEIDVARYSMLTKPFWVDLLVDALRGLAELRVKKKLANERVARLSEAVRKVTQRVNLFEKVLIPQAEENIRRINIFLADAQRVSVVRSKIAKAKTVARTAVH
jgi:V/A-type H+-transporting ATPase subunit D